MAKLVVDIKMLGDKELEKALATWPGAVQKTTLRNALRRSGKRFKGEMVSKLSGHPVTPQTGRLKAGIEAQKVTRDSKKRDSMRYGVPLPTRAALGIPPGYEWYYPMAVEYGHKRAPPRSYIRAAVDENYANELERTRQFMRQDLIRKAGKHFRRARA